MKLVFQLVCRRNNHQH